VYDVAEDGKTTTQLRAHVRRLAKELDDMKSVVSLLTMAPDRAQAANWASELEKNGFAHHSVEEVKKSLQVGILEHMSRFLLIKHRTRQPHGLRSQTRTLSKVKVMSSFQDPDMIWELRRMRDPREQKGETIYDKTVAK
jgi:hypothetical protein